MAKGPTNAAVASLVVSVLGAALDFYSSYRILSYPTMGMMEPSQSATVWGVGLASLGVVLLVTASAGVSSFGVGRMALLGALMAIYGVLMFFLGAAMDLGVSPGMQTAMLAGVGMLAVGVLMVVNGYMMLRQRRVPRPGLTPSGTSGAKSAQGKMSMGIMVPTTQLGLSTSSWILRSAATLQRT
jgi:hypothetical protein